MNKSLLNSTILMALLTTASSAALAGSLTVPNTFTSGTTAVAADVNANFTAVKTAVDDNDGRITTNATGIATNVTDIATNATAIATKADATAVTANAAGIATNVTGIATNATGIAANVTGIATNATGIAANTTSITTNATGIATNTTGIATNVTDIATNATGIAANVTAIATNATGIATNATAITALQAANTCPSDMVAAGSLCIDKYEASVWTAATGGTQIISANIATTCTSAGNDCVNTIYARSVAGVAPAALISQYQAAVACASVGKRLPTTAEWQMAAAGTPTGTCNTGGALANTGSIPACISNAGAFDMIGNLWEWSADLSFDAAAAGATTTDFSTSRALGDDYLGNGTDSIKDVWVLTGTGPGTGPDDVGNIIFGFRCVK